MVKVRLFGMLKTLVSGVSELDIALPSGARVKDLVEALDAQYPELGKLLLQKKVLVSVNQDIAHWDTALFEQDEIALLPPFAGGGKGRDDGRKVTHGC
jgi:molybdopterin converting factor small subunit